MATATAFKTTQEATSQTETLEVVTPINFAHGQSLFVYVAATDSQVFTVPTLALKKRSNNYFLWKLEGEDPVQIQVEVVAEDGEFSQIFSRELNSGDPIISNPSVSLFKKSE